MSNLGNDTAHPVQHGGVQGQQTAPVLGAHPSMNVPAYPKTATPGGFYHPQHHAQPYATANGTVWGSGRDPRTAGAMAPPAGLPGICGVSGVVSAAASAAQAAWLGSQSGRASEALPTAKRTHDGQLVQHARSHAGWAQAQGCPRDGAPPPHSAPSPGPLTGAAASSTPVATSNDSGVPHQPASSPRGAAAAGAPPTDLTGSLVDPPRSAFLPGPPSSAAIAGPATTDLAGLGEPLAGSGDAKGVEGAAGGAVQLLAVASNTAVAAAAGKENVHTPPKKGGQNYNGLYLSLLLEALLDACKTRDDGKWRMKTTCSTNWGEQKAIADAVFEKWQKASLDERMRYGGRSDSTLEYGKGAQANFLTSKKHQYRKWANQPAEARNAANATSTMWRRLAPTMEAFFRLDSDTACDEPNAQQSKAQGVFKDAKKKKEEAKDRKAANDKIGAFGNALDKMKANMAENQQPMREALEIAKRDEARKDAREKRAIEDGKKMEQERQAAEKERREFRKSGDEFRRKSLENLCYIRCEECKQEVDLCAACFFAGMEPLGHKKTHRYRVMDKLDKPIFTEDWTAAEELSLMDQVKKMGLGAWEEISDSKLFYRRHSSSELNARYLDTYLSQYGSVLPPCYLKHRPDGSGADKVPIPLTHPANCPPNQRGVKVSSKEIRGRTIAELGTNPRYRYEPSWQALAEKQQQRKEESEEAAAAAAAASANGLGAAAAKGTIGAPNGVGGGAVGFACAGNGAVGGDAAGSATGQNRSNTKQRRRRADKVNKAKEEEREIREWTEKLPGADLSVYAPLRGDFDHEHDDTAEELLANMEFRPTDHASEKQLKLDVIAVYNHRLDEREKRKKFVIENNLLDYKKPPPGSKKRGREDRELVARLRPFARFSNAKEHDELIDNLIAAKKIRARIETLQMYRQNGITTIAEGIEFDKARQRRQEELASQKHRESASYLYDGHASAKGSTGDRNRRYKDRNKGGGMSDGNGDDGRNGNNLLDVEGAPGVEYLSPAERALCSQLHLLPGYYLVIKNAMIQECVKSGCLKKSNLAGLATLDKPRLDKMYDFFSTSGWVTEKHRDFEISGAAANAIPGSPPA